MWHYAPADRKFRDLQSRHYYDVVRLYRHGVGKAAVKETDLLLKVPATRKYFSRRLGTLRRRQAGHAPVPRTFACASWRATTEKCKK